MIRQRGQQGGGSAEFAFCNCIATNCIPWIQLRVSQFVTLTFLWERPFFPFPCMPSLPARTQAEIQGLGGRAVLAGGVWHCDAKVPVAFLAALCHHASHHL